MKDSYRSLWAGALSAGVVLAVGVLGTPPAAAAPSAAAPSAPADAAPQLSIAIDNGKTSTTTGESLDYVITIQNLGGTDVKGLLINQSLPVGLTFRTADGKGTIDADGVNWKLDLKAAATATFKTSATVAATPESLLRLATVACASTVKDGPPIVCATHSDQLPAGAAAAAAEQAALTTAAASPVTDERPWWYLPVGIAGVLLIAGLLTAVLLGRRRRRGVADTDTDSGFGTENALGTGLELVTGRGLEAGSGIGAPRALGTGHSSGPGETSSMSEWDPNSSMSSPEQRGE